MADPNPPVVDPVDHPRTRSQVTARLRAAGCVFAEDEAGLLLGAAESPVELDRLVRRRVSGEPLEHVLGWAEFCGLRVGVEPGVFVPRHRTEALVREAAALVRQVPELPVVLDLCCGSGAIGLAVHAAAAPFELHAADVDPVAVRCARRNLAGMGGSVYEGDLFRPLPASLRGRVDVLVANVPYVPTDAVAGMPPEARDHEPRQALDGGRDGLETLRRVAAGAGDWLRAGGHVLMETSERQAPAALTALRDAGLVARISAAPDDDATVAIGRRP
jgi:release factor glutamine methyltransferase